MVSKWGITPKYPICKYGINTIYKPFTNFLGHSSTIVQGKERNKTGSLVGELIVGFVPNPKHASEYFLR